MDEFIKEEEWEMETHAALRDMFAMFAMSTLVAMMGTDPKAVAINAYRIADAMMVAMDLS